MLTQVDCLLVVSVKYDAKGNFNSTGVPVMVTVKKHNLEWNF